MVNCDVAPLYCAYILLDLPYQGARNVVYHEKTHQYHLQLQGHTYVLTLTNNPSHSNPNLKTSPNQCISLCLIRPLKANNLTNPFPKEMQPLITKFSDVFEKPTGLPPMIFIEHSIDLIPDTPLPNALAYTLAPR